MAISTHDILSKYEPAVVTLGLQPILKKGIKLGFYKGSELPDPQHLLTGAGKVHRHVEITSADLINSHAIQALITAAVAAYKQRIA